MNTRRMLSFTVAKLKRLGKVDPTRRLQTRNLDRGASDFGGDCRSAIPFAKYEGNHSCHIGIVACTMIVKCERQPQTSSPMFGVPLAMDLQRPCAASSLHVLGASRCPDPTI